MDNYEHTPLTAMAVCAIILDYFGADKTIACLTSLLDQGIDFVFVVDNSGNQQAAAKLQEAMEEFTSVKRPFGIHLLVNPTNMGFGAGMNMALKWLEDNQPYQYYLLINNDAQASPGMLPELLRHMKQNSRLAICAPVIDTGKQILKGFWYQRFSGLMFLHPTIGSFSYLSGCCLLIDHRIINNGLFDEDFFMYGEDVELSWRMQRSDWHIACIHQAVVRHLGVGSSHQGEFFYEYHVVRGHMLLAKKLAQRAWHIPFFYLGRLIAISTRLVLRSFRFRSFVPIKASLSAIYDARKVKDQSWHTNQQQS